MAMERQGPLLGGRDLGQGVYAELLRQEGIVQPHVYPGRQGLAVVVAQQLAGVPLLPQQRIVAEVGAEGLLAPGGAARVADGAEGRHRAVAAGFAQRGDQCPVAPHGVAADGTPGRDREVGLDELGQLPGDVVIHLVVGPPGVLGGVDIEAGPHAEIVTGVVRYPLAARAGVRRYQGDAELGGDALGPRLLHEVLVGAGEAGEPVEHGHLLAGEGLGRQIDGEAHLAA
ncbi:hypothetical protein D3C77_292350 [compost metagenome]